MQTGQGYSSPDEHAFWERWYHRHLQHELTLADIHFVGEQLFRDRNACAIYGYSPEQAYAQGIRLLGRTVIEYCVDVQARAIAAGIQRYLQHHGLGGPIAVVDLFAGSGNLLYHIADTLRADQGLGFEADPLVTQLTTRNLAIVASPWHVIPASWQDFDPSTIADTIQTLVMIVDPPWGQGHTSDSLDLRATEPPVPDILAELIPRLHHQTIWVIKTFEQTVPESITTITDQLTYHHYDTLTILTPGTNVGYILGVTGQTQ